MKFLQLSSIAFVSFFLTFFNDIQTLFSLNSLSENPKSLIHLSPVLAQTSTDKKAEADRVFNQGIQQAQTSQYREAIQSWEQSLKLYREIGDRNGEANSLNNLGIAYDSLGQYQKAIEFYQQSLSVQQQIGDRNGEAKSLNNLGSAYDSLGQYQKAIEFYQQSLSIKEEIGDRNGVATSLNNLGSAYWSLGEYQKAIKFHQQSLSIKEEIGDHNGVATSLMNLGSVYSNLGQYQKAIEFYQQSLSIFQKIGAENGMASSLMGLGNAYRSLGEYQKAIKLHQQSLSIFQEIGAKNGVATSLNSLGNVYLSLGEYQKAIEFYQQSLSIHQEIGDRNGVANSLGNLGSAYWSLGEYEKAIEFHQQSLSIEEEIGDHNDVAASINSLGNVYLSLGEYEKAIKLYQQSLSIKEEIGDRNGVATSLNNLGSAYENLGEYEKAIKLYQQSLSIQQEIGDHNGVASSMMNLGNVYLSLGEYEKAIKLYQQSLSIQQEIGDRNGVANSLNNLGSAYESLGEYEKAIKLYQQSLSIQQEIGDRNGVAGSLIGLGSAYESLGEYQKAIEFYQHSLSIFQEIGARKGVASSLNNLGNSYSSLGQYEKAIRFYQQSLSISQEISARNVVAKSLHNLGTAYLALGQSQKAIEFYQQSLSIFQEIGARKGVASSLNNLGLAYRDRGQLEESEQWLKEAIKSHELLRLGLKDLDKISIFDTQINSYILLQNVLIKQNKIEEGLEIADRARARALIDELAKRHLDLPKEAIEFPPLSIEQIKQTAQNKKANLVIYSIIYDRFKTPQNLMEIKESELYIWVVKPTGEVHFRQVDLKPLWQQQQTTLEEIVSKTTVSLATGGIYRSDEPRFPQVGDLVRLKGSEDPEIYPSRIIAVNQQTQTVTVTNPSFDQESEEKPISDIISYETSPVAHHQGSQQLHQLLIEPIADLLPKDENERIIFIPQGALLYVPFAALQDQQGNVLIQKHTILTAPAIQVLAIAPDHQSTGKNALVVGNPIMPKIANQVGETPKPLSPLPGSEQEAKAIAQLLQTEAILGKNATETAIIEKMPQADIIHFATHGLIGDFTGGGVPGAIALTPNPSASSPDIWGLDGGDGLLMAEEILKLKLKANLVVLSACSTGQGRLTGDGIIGLSRSLMTAGVPTVLVTLWKVDDDKTVTLMTEFYRQLQQNPDKAKALRTAMLKLLQTDPKPQYWAAFTLIGAPE